ncbi:MULTISPECIES: transglutaminase domain-containing protein [unclassified Brachybacterium]|uniref:transglutaminase domain-containing protein n=1 Tax=unclassified Brachybacterium TaxID=2623841 RepID=UPI0036113328
MTIPRLVELYESVRGLPYDTVAAFDAAGLRAQGRGNCVAKAALLAEELSNVGMQCRMVCWEYELPVLVDVQRELRFFSDIHTAVEVHVDDRWALVDATHDPALASLGLTVGSWDGASATEPAYRPVGPVIPHDRQGRTPALDEAATRIGHQVERTDPELVSRYQEDLNRLFEKARSSP